MASEFTNLKKAVTRMVAAEVEYANRGAHLPEDNMIKVQQELDNSRSNYKYRLEELRRVYHTVHLVRPLIPFRHGCPSCGKTMPCSCK